MQLVFEYMVVQPRRIDYFRTKEEALAFARNSLRGRKYYYYSVYKIGDTTPIEEYIY